ncbi:MAG: polyamine aminopropyltransferase [Bacillota bacterium]
MELWFTERQTPNLSIGCRIDKTLIHERTEYQDLAIIDTLQYGRMLVLDGCVMTTEKDEFVYHEMISHVPLATHPNPKKVLVVGGGDGGVIREALRHSSVEKAVLAEIDGAVVRRSQEFLPSIAAGLKDPRAVLAVGDGVKHVKEHRGEYDVIVCDSTDPVGPAVGLFSKEFFTDAREALTPDGIFVAQSESPFLHGELITRVMKDLAAVFPVARLYWAVIPTYPGAMWTFAIGSKKHDPATDFRRVEFPTKYYSPDIHRAAFVLPPFAAALVR